MTISDLVNVRPITLNICSYRRQTLFTSYMYIMLYNLELHQQGSFRVMYVVCLLKSYTSYIAAALVLKCWCVQVICTYIMTDQTT